MILPYFNQLVQFGAVDSYDGHCNARPLSLVVRDSQRMLQRLLLPHFL
jgi:hypothetical protein